MSATPTPYNRSYDFEDYQAANPTSPLPGDELDSQLDAVEAAIDSTQSRLAEIQNNDGTVKNASIGTEQLKSDVVIGARTVSVWATATAYIIGDCVYQSNNVYRCVVAHTSSAAFATDLATKWTIVINIGQYVDAAAASAVSAAASDASAGISANAAQTAQTNAETAETNAETAQAAAEAAAAQAASGTFTRTQATGNGVLDTFAVTYDVGYLVVYLDGVLQDPADYTASSGTQVVFDSPPGNLVKIDMIALGTFASVALADLAVTTGKLAAGAVTPAKSEPGAFWWANVTGGSVAHAVTLNPAMPSYAPGNLLRYNGGTGNNALSLITPTSVTSSGTLATVNYTSHGLAVYDIIYMSGCTQTEYNGLHVVATVPGPNSFTYYFAGSTTSPATGSPLYRHAAPGGSTAYTGGMTVNVNSLGAKDMRRIRGHKLIPGDVYTNDEIMGSYDGTLFRLFNPAQTQVVTAVQYSDDSSTAYKAFGNEIPLSTIVPFLCAFRAEITNTASATLQVVDSMGAAVTGTIYKKGGTALNAGDIIGGRWHLMLWGGYGAATGGSWELFSPTADLEQRPRTAILEDQQTAGTDGGSPTTGAWTARVLNTEASDDNALTTLPGSNQFTLIAGTYNVVITAPFNGTGDTRLRLRRITAAAATIALSDTCYFDGYGGVVTIDAVFTITSTITFEVQYYCGSTGPTGLGLGKGYSAVPVPSVTEVFTRVKIQKIG